MGYKLVVEQITLSDLFIIKEFENDDIISQMVGIGEVCDQNGDRVSRNDKSCHICSDRLKRTFSNL